MAKDLKSQVLEINQQLAAHNALVFARDIHATDETYKQTISNAVLQAKKGDLRSLKQVLINEKEMTRDNQEKIDQIDKILKYLPDKIYLQN